MLFKSDYILDQSVMKDLIYLNKTKFKQDLVGINSKYESSEVRINNKFYNF